MNSTTKPFYWVINLLALGVLATSVAAYAQEQPDDPPPNEPPPTSEAKPGWRRFSGPPPQANPLARPPEEDPQQPEGPPPAAVPPRLTIPAGTFVTVRVDQYISSDKNQKGDGFSATLAKPLVADGVVIAQRGQTLGGRVVEAEKAGRVKGVSHLAVQLESLTLVDGQQVPIETALTNFRGPTSNGRDAGAVATTTVLGAAIGAGADYGQGAAIGAGAGLAAGLVGVLVTRGRSTVIYPESMLTFRIAKPISFSTERAPQAFAYVNEMPPEPPSRGRQGPPPTGYQRYGNACGPEGCPPPPPPYYYPPYPYPYYWGPSFSYWYGPRYYGGYGYYRGGRFGVYGRRR